MKHTICIEARPFAVFNATQMERILALENCEILDCRGKTIDNQDFIEALEKSDIIISGNDLYFDENLFARLPKLKLIAKLGVGLDMIDIPAASRHNVMVCNTPGANDVAVAEHTFALLLGLLRRIPRCDKGMRDKKWEQGVFLGREISGSTFGILGMGSIGRCVAKLALGFNGKVIGYDPYWPTEFAKENNIERCTLETLLSESDFLCIHCPLTEQTQNLIGAIELATMKKSAVLVNMARGGIVDEKALYEALLEKQISGAVVDAYMQEPPSDVPFTHLDTVILSPHAGAFTEEALDKMACIALDQVIQHIHGEQPCHIRNPSAC